MSECRKCDREFRGKCAIRTSLGVKLWVSGAGPSLSGTSIDHPVGTPPSSTLSSTSSNWPPDKGFDRRFLRENCVGRDGLPKYANGWHGNTTDEDIFTFPYPLYCHAIRWPPPLVWLRPRAAAGSSSQETASSAMTSASVPWTEPEVSFFIRGCACHPWDTLLAAAMPRQDYLRRYFLNHPSVLSQ